MYYIGIDVGGTNLKAGLVDESYQIVAVKKAPLHFQSMDQMGETLARMALELVEEKAVAREQVPRWAWASPARWTTGGAWSSRR